MAEMLVDNPDQPGTKESVSPVPARKEPSELVITNVDGDLRIDGFRVSAWNGVVPGTVDIGKPRLLRTDGRQEIADVIAYDAAKGEIRFKDEMGERVEKLAGLAQIIVSDQRLAPTGNGLHLHLHTGDRLFGRPLASPSGQLRLQHASLGRVLEISIADLQSVSVQIDKETTARVVASMRSPSAVADAATKVAEPPGAGDSQLQWNGGLLKGRLVDGSRSIGSTALVWKAAVADSPTSLRGDFSGKIVANKKLEPTGGSAPKDVATQDGEQPVGMVARLMQRTLRAAFGAANAPADAAPSAVADSSTIAASNALDAANTPPASSKFAVNRIHLRTGEVIPCNRLAVDEQGVRIESPVAASKRLAHSQVKAIELLPNAKPPQPAKVKRDRLLMVPRVNRDHPPTHVVRSRDADYLRGRLIELNEKELTIEVRMETKRLPRALVSHVIWISPDELAGPVPPAGPAGPSGPTSPAVPAGSPGAADGDAAASPAAPPIPRADSGLMVLALRKDGVRLAFEPTECRDGIIAGTNRNLGDVRVDVRHVDEFLIGGAIAEARAAMPYARWRWTAATLPKVASAQGKDADGARLPGIDSPLVGKPAPDFKLPMLSGKEDFELSKQRGRIVVLDFWATWCGPCLKTIPVLDKVVGELPPEAKVDLVAVNLEETPKQIASLLERQKWKMAVALDQDGAVAAKYAAAAIPQTVIVDRDGKVARLFVGGGPQFEADLRAAIAELLRRQ
jgi:thiol-disulfide isomerase/thioredoxin